MPKKLTSIPELPNNVGRIRRFTDIHKQKRALKIEAEVKLRCDRGDAAFALYLQKFKVLEGSWQDNILYRIGYYAIIMSGKRKGKWGWGQYAVLARPEEFMELFRLAREAGWNL